MPFSSNPIQNIPINPQNTSIFQKIWPIANKIMSYILPFLNKHSLAISTGFVFSYIYYTQLSGKSSIKEKTWTSLTYGILATTVCSVLYFIISKIVSLTFRYFQNFFPLAAISLEIFLLGRFFFVILFPSEKRSFFN